MSDKIEKIGSSIIQHGEVNNRIYLMYLHENDYATAPKKLIDMAQKFEYEKIFAKVPSSAIGYFQRYEFFKEAFIPSFYNGSTGMYCMAKFIDKNRQNIASETFSIIQDNIQLAQKNKMPGRMDFASDVKALDETHAESLAQLFKLVFPSYPFPIDDPEILKKNMQEDVKYFGILQQGTLIAASSAEMDVQHSNAEMTDFATHPDFRGKGSALYLLQSMEVEMKNLGIQTCYTIARSLSAAMNITFARNGYQFGGTLKNNTQIFDHIESMNVWYKHI